MKRKFAHYSGWQPLREHGYAGMAVADPTFVGHVALVAVVALDEPPAWLTLPDRRVPYADDGSFLLQYFPAGAQHLVSTLFDCDGDVVGWYIDIVKAHGLGEDGIPWYDDLYLDIVVLPDGARHLLDEDELDAALDAGAITAADRALAHAEAARVMAALDAGPLPTMVRCRDDLARLRTLPMMTFKRDADGD
jgi:predicted RNA-binding protein associated with RNAse of E/G family